MDREFLRIRLEYLFRLTSRLTGYKQSKDEPQILIELTISEICSIAIRLILENPKPGAVIRGQQFVDDQFPAIGNLIIDRFNRLSKKAAEIQNSGLPVTIWFGQMEAEIAMAIEQLTDDVIAQYKAAV